MTEIAIDVRRLTKKFGAKIVVNNIDIQVPKGKIYGFLGPNGSGKTTTIRMLCGLLRPTSGEGKCLGLDIMKDALMIRKKVGYMTQKFSFWDDLTVRENLEFTAHVYELKNASALIDKTLINFGLEKKRTSLQELFPEAGNKDWLYQHVFYISLKFYYLMNQQQE